MRIIPNAPTSNHTTSVCLVLDQEQWQYLYDLLAEEADWRATIQPDDSTDTPAIAALYDEIEFIEKRRRLGMGGDE